MPESAPASDWIVLKFGGTSVSQRHRWDTIGRLMRERAEAEDAKVLVVVSALSGVTNQLQSAIDRADNEAFLADLNQQLRERHLGFARELGLEAEAVLRSPASA